MLDQFGQVGGDAGDHDLHAHRPVREILQEFGDVQPEFRRLRAIELVEHDQDPRPDHLGQHIAGQAHRDRRFGQQVADRRATLGGGVRWSVSPVVEQRNVAGHGAEGLVEARAGAAGDIGNQIARLTGRLGQDVQNRRLADAALPIDHGVETLVLDRSDEGRHHFRTTGEHPPVRDGLRGREGVAELHPQTGQAIVQSRIQLIAGGQLETREGARRRLP